MSLDFINGLIGGLVAAAVTMTGWFITDYLRRRDANHVRVESYIEKQIIELYTPLYFLAEAEIRYRQMRDKAVDAVPENKKLEIWWAYSEKFVVPTQMQIYDLLKTKWYLLIDDHVHPSIYVFMRHYTDALSLFTLDQQGTKLDASIPAEAMPDIFVTNIKEDLDSLREAYFVTKNLRGWYKKHIPLKL